MIFRPVTVHTRHSPLDQTIGKPAKSETKGLSLRMKGQSPRARLRTFLRADWKRKQNFANMAVTMYAFLEAILLLVNGCTQRRKILSQK